jgi:hypothetical protein
MYDNIKKDEWLTEYCLLCSSVNHIFVSNADADAWECWSCFSNWWLDDIALNMYTINNGIEEEEANQHLISSNPNIIFLHGQPSR